MKTIPSGLVKALVLILPVTLFAACSDDNSPDTGMNNNNGLPNSDTTDTATDVLPVIRVETWEEILRNVVALINADRALERHNTILDRVVSLSELVLDETVFDDTSGTLASMGLTMQPLVDPDNRFVVDYSCNTDGSLNVTLSPGENKYAMVADNCAIDGDVYDGGFTHFVNGREGASSNLDNMNVTLADSTAYLLSGSYSTFYDRPGVRRSYEWTAAEMLDETENGPYTVEFFNILSESASGNLGEFFHSAAVTGSFTVSADWTDNKPVQVAVDLALGGSFLAEEVVQNTLRSQWTSGSISVVAADESQLRLVASESDPASAVVEVSGLAESQQVLWGDAYQVRCFADASAFPNCQ